MSTKEQILGILEKQHGSDISGQQIALQLGLSRNAVWKAIQALQKDGYHISAATNRGYRLSGKNDILSKQGIASFLTDKSLTKNLKIYRTLPSTNLTARELAHAGAPGGTVVIADEQTVGRGRMGRDFFSPAGSGVYMSILLRPDMSIQNGLLITTAAAVAVCRAIEGLFDVAPRIKWVNDILIGGKKVCGILTEGAAGFESGSIDHIILGIGINFSTALHTFPDEIKTIAASLSHSQSPVVRNALIAAVLDQLFALLPGLESREFIGDYKSRSAVLGKQIEIVRGGETTPCTAVDITRDGGLVVRYADGRQETLTSGEISVRGDFYCDRQKRDEST